MGVLGLFGPNLDVFHFFDIYRKQNVNYGVEPPNILLYVHDEDMLSVASTNKYLGEKVQEAQNTKEIYIYSSVRRVRRRVIFFANTVRGQLGAGPR